MGRSCCHDKFLLWAEGLPIHEVASHTLLHLDRATGLDGIIIFSAFLMSELRFRVVRVTSKDQEMEGFP